MSTEVQKTPQLPLAHNEVPAKPRSGRTKRVYRCGHCARQFKRSEHCARHERVHSGEKPFDCSYCNRRYARKDLVKRHERSLHAEAYQAAHPSEFLSQPKVSTRDNNGTYSPRIVTLPQQSHPEPSPITPPAEKFALDMSVQTEQAENMHEIPNMMTPPLYGINETYFPHGSLGQKSPPASYTGNNKNVMPVIDSDESFEVFLVAHYNSVQLQSDLGTAIPTVQIADKPPHIIVDPFLLTKEDRDTQRAILEEEAYQAGLRMDDPLPIENEKFSEFQGITSSQFGTASDSFLFSELDEIWPRYSLDQGQSPSGQSPQIQREQFCELPKYNFDDCIHRKLCEDACFRMSSTDTATLLPSVSDLNRFFSGYLDCFHRHFPIIHLPSLDLTETPSPLIFAMCSIGAQYRLERRKAKNLFALAGTMSSYALRAGLPIAVGTPGPAPLWIMQTRVLLSLCGIFSGKTSVVMRTVENLGLFAIDYRLRRSLLSTPKSSRLDWEEWISRESSKRLLCGMFIVSNLISTTFGMNPGFSHTQDLEFEILDDERLWNARSPREWRGLRETRCTKPTITVRDAMAEVLNSQPDNQAHPHLISGFTMLLIMHAVNIHMWSLLQFTDITGLHTGVHAALLSSASATLSRCHQAVLSVRGGEDHGTTWSEAEGPLMFNCQALLRIAHIRLFTNIRAFNRLTLLSDNPDDIFLAVNSYAEAPQTRSSSLTEAVSKAYVGFLSPIKIGHLLVRKTAALSWSIEHAVAGWDAALFLTKWVHTLDKEAVFSPPDAEENAILQGLKQLLVEADSDYDGRGSLAAAIARVWSTFLSDVWVWGVTPKMGFILTQLALAYENDLRL
ncbi:fungal-specific transcription factor domain-domain-containing protein [Clohesyomyces aquaticus]|uniref:Fungal-specific transcription factor domain-domain-containing protein n=1 Tax=Clohesyomyces aquaticus TaxID=1231657 RepID=A0A1Y2A0N9_9PLEO|nr:fungal-specific transcription factor domain-domain-containing protein [Clohesyomyces aquaticus]